MLAFPHPYPALLHNCTTRACARWRTHSKTSFRPDASHDSLVVDASTCVPRTCVGLPDHFAVHGRYSHGGMDIRHSRVCHAENGWSLLDDRAGHPPPKCTRRACVAATPEMVRPHASLWCCVAQARMSPLHSVLMFTVWLYSVGTMVLSVRRPLVAVACLTEGRCTGVCGGGGGVGAHRVPCLHPVCHKHF